MYSYVPDFLFNIYSGSACVSGEDQAGVVENIYFRLMKDNGEGQSPPAAVDKLILSIPSPRPGQ